MKKIFLSFMLAICLLLPCTLMLTGCGDQFIEERTYNLLGMTIIRDNTPGEGYSHFEDGEYATSLTGQMYLEKCKIEVGSESSVLIFDDTAESGIKATYNFDVYTGSEVYPAFSFSSYSITIDGNDSTNLSQLEIADLADDVENIYEDVKQFANVCLYGDMSIQLITQNRSFACHVLITEKETGSLVFMSVLYGY